MLCLHQSFERHLHNVTLSGDNFIGDLSIKQPVDLPVERTGIACFIGSHKRLQSVKIRSCRLSLHSAAESVNLTLQSRFDNSKLSRSSRVSDTVSGESGGFVGLVRPKIGNRIAQLIHLGLQLTQAFSRGNRNGIAA